MIGETITSAAELDALPVGSRVRDRDDDVWVKLETGWLLDVWAVGDDAACVARFQPLILIDRPSGVTVSDEDREALATVGRMVDATIEHSDVLSRSDLLAALDSLSVSINSLASRPQAAPSVSQEALAAIICEGNVEHLRKWPLVAESAYCGECYDIAERVLVSLGLVVRDGE